MFRTLTHRVHQESRQLLQLATLMKAIAHPCHRSTTCILVQALLQCQYTPIKVTLLRQWQCQVTSIITLHLTMQIHGAKTDLGEA